jgi:hypothetical protein
MKRPRRLAVDAEIDTIPVLSVIVHLIPMLLLGVRFVQHAEVRAPDPLVRAENTPGQYTVTYTTEATGLLLSDEVCRCASPVALGPAPVG